MASSTRYLRSLLVLPLVALAGLSLPDRAQAGVCPVPACIPGEILPGSGAALPQNAPGIAYRQLKGPFVPRPASAIDAGPDAEFVPPGAPVPTAVILGPDGKELCGKLKCTKTAEDAED